MRDPRVPRGEPREGARGKGGIGWHGMGEDAVQAWSGATGEAHRRRELKGPRSEVGWCHQHARATPKGARSTGSTATLSSSPYSPTLLSDPLVAWLKDMASTSPYVSAPASAPSQLVETLGKLTASLPELPQVEWTYKTIATSVLAVVVTLLLVAALWYLSGSPPASRAAPLKDAATAERKRAAVPSQPALVNQAAHKAAPPPLDDDRSALSDRRSTVLTQRIVAVGAPLNLPRASTATTPDSP